MEGLDVMNRLRLENLRSSKTSETSYRANRFDIQITYLVVQESRNFSPRNRYARRMMIVTVAYCKYINQYDIPEEVYELLSYNKVKIEGIAQDSLKNMLAKSNQIITWMKTYGRSFKYSPKSSRWLSNYGTADPIYVVAEDQVRAVVWLELTKHKMEKTKINMAALAGLRFRFESHISSSKEIQSLLQ